MGKNSNMQWDVIVVGAGASGMMAAISAARTNKKVLILEQMDKPGKKLLATGNGKCNFTNEKMETDCFHGDSSFIQQVLDYFTVEDCLAFFHSIGIYPKNKNGYFYPNSEQAASVVAALVTELERLQVEVKFETVITEIIPEDTGIKVICNKGTFGGTNLIIATGLLAAPKLGSNGSLFSQIKTFGHRFQPILPALCGFYCKGLKFKNIAGVRATGTVTAYVNNEKKAEDTGEIQFVDYGISGIPVFQISHYLSKGLYNKEQVAVHINLLPDFDKKTLMDELEFRKSIAAGQTMETYLNGLINQKLALMILDKVGLDRNLLISSLKPQDLERLSIQLQKLEIMVINYRDFEFAQVCTGGISVDEIYPDTLESRFVKHIYFAGEILDVDGICGGYNLHFAWATGYIAGNAVGCN